MSALQYVGEQLLFQALLPMVTARSATMLTSLRDAEGGAKVLQWTPGESTPAEVGSVEDALLTVLQLVAGKIATRHRDIFSALSSSA